MGEEKKHLPPVKEFLEQMYGVKLEEPKQHSQEEWELFWKKAEEGIKQRQTGQKDT